MQCRLLGADRRERAGIPVGDGGCVEGVAEPRQVEGPRNASSIAIC